MAPKIKGSSLELEPKNQAVPEVRKSPMEVADGSHRWKSPMEVIHGSHRWKSPTVNGRAVEKGKGEEREARRPCLELPRFGVRVLRPPRVLLRRRLRGHQSRSRRRISGADLRVPSETGKC